MQSQGLFEKPGQRRAKGLVSDKTVHNRYSDSSRAEYSEELVRAWILGRDGVLDQEEYEGGATWENLRKALRELNHIR